MFQESVKGVLICFKKVSRSIQRKLLEIFKFSRVLQRISLVVPMKFQRRFKEVSGVFWNASRKFNIELKRLLPSSVPVPVQWD